jgi:hypothetical protein
MTPSPASLEPREHILVVPGTQSAWKAVNGILLAVICEILVVVMASSV